MNPKNETGGLLAGKNAVIHGGGGAIGGAVARAFAQAGAAVHLTGRTRARLEATAADIERADGRVFIDVVDALDLDAVEAHADRVMRRAGSFDIVLNAIGVPHVQGVPLAELPLDDFLHPVTSYVRSNYLTARAAGRHMTAQKSGVILTLVAPGGVLQGPGYIGYGVACGALETLSRHLAAEFAPHVRTVCLRPDAIPEALARGSHAGEVFSRVARQRGTTVEAMMAEYALARLLRRLPTLDDVAHTAVFFASDHARAMTGVVASLTGGTLID